MANLSDVTRKDQVLARLRAEMGSLLTNGWVDGPDLANEEVGGSEGLKRLRELRAEGHLIQTRKHPDPRRDIFQYRLVEQSSLAERTPIPVAARESPNGGPRRSDPVHPVGDRPPHVVEAPNPEVDRYDWKLETAASREFRRTFWVRNPKQRLIGTVAVDFDKSRWFWSVKRPKYKGKYGEVRPEKTLGHGIINVPGGAGMLEAMAAVEARVRELKEDKSW